MTAWTSDQAKNELWDKHLSAEFKNKSTEEALSTMTDTPRSTSSP
jgi:hypothetical protein